MKYMRVVRGMMLALGLLLAGQAEAVINFSFFGRTLGKKVNPKLANIDKECQVLKDLLLPANQIFNQEGVVFLFDKMDVSKHASRKSAAGKIKKEFDTALAGVRVDVLENATEQELMEFVGSLAREVSSVLEFHKIIAPICQATLDNVEQIRADKTCLKNAQNFFISVVKPLEDTVNLLLGLAQNEQAIKLISQFVPQFESLEGEIEVSMQAYDALGIRRPWELWDIAKWSAAAGVTIGTLYIVYQNRDALSSGINSMMRKAKTYIPSWAGIKGGFNDAVESVKHNVAKVSDAVKRGVRNASDTVSTSLWSAKEYLGDTAQNIYDRARGRRVISDTSKTSTNKFTGPDGKVINKTVTTKERVTVPVDATIDRQKALQDKIDNLTQDISESRKNMASLPLSERKREQIENKKRAIERDKLQKQLRKLSN